MKEYLEEKRQELDGGRARSTSAAWDRGLILAMQTYVLDAFACSPSSRTSLEPTQ